MPRHWVRDFCHGKTKPVSLLALFVGVVSGAVSFVGLWGISYFLAKRFEPETQPPIHPGVFLIALVLKVPALLMGWWFCAALGTPGLRSFGLGIVLVYSLAVALLAIRGGRR